jgi:hypothetical protein
MQTAEHSGSGLRKARRTGADFPEMSWRLCRVHAISISDEEREPLDFAEGRTESERGGVSFARQVFA